MKEITSNWAEFAVKEEGVIIMGDDGKTGDSWTRIPLAIFPRRIIS